MYALSPLYRATAIISTDPLLERLFLASLELAALAVVIAVVIRLARIRSPRLTYLLWMVVLIKPLVSLTVGTLVPIVRFDAPSSRITATADADIFPLAPGFAFDSGHPGSNSVTAGMADDGAAGKALIAEALGAEVATSKPTLTEFIRSLPVSRMIVGVWLAGMMVFLFFHLLGRFRLYRLIRAGRPPCKEVSFRYRDLRSRLGLQRIPRLLVTDALESPALVGLVRPTILIPSWLDAKSGGPKIDWTLRHELTHFKWCDPAAVLVRDVSIILFWFHPVIRWSGKRLIEAMELACDRAMLRNPSQASDYAEQLFRVLQEMRNRRQPVIAGGLFASRTQVGKRIAALLEASFSLGPQLTTRSAVGVVILAFLSSAVGIQLCISSPPEAVRPVGPGARIVLFPENHSLGHLAIRDWESTNRLEKWGRALGAVAIPSGQELWLYVLPHAANDLHALASLRPDAIQSLSLLNTNVNDVELAHITGLTGLRRLDLRGTQITDAGLTHITVLADLRYLDIDADGITDAGFAHIGKLKSLEELRLPLNKGITDRALAHIKMLTSLRRLRICGTGISETGLAQLVDCRSLESLTLNRKRISDTGWAYLKQIRGLKHLGGLQVTDANLGHLADLRALEKLALDAHVSDKGMVHLSKMTGLKELSIISTRVSGAALAHLRGLSSLRKLSLTDVNLSGKGMAHIAALASLEELNLLHCGCTDADLACLKSLGSLKKLTLNRVPITDVGLKHLAGLPAIEALTLDFINTGEGGLAPLADLASLKELRVHTISDKWLNAVLQPLPPGKRAELQALDHLPLRDTDLSSLSDFTSLKRLTLDRTAIDDAGLAHLSELAELESLSLQGTQVTDAGLAHLSDTTTLRSLFLNDTQITDVSLAHLKKLTNMSRLEVANTGTTDAGLKHLAGLSSLEYIKVEGTKITEEGLAQLPAAYRLMEYQGRKTSLPRVMRNTEDMWDYYVRHFVRTHQLDQSQREIAYSVLRELKKEASLYREAHETEFVALGDELKNIPDSDSHPDQKAAAGTREAILNYNHRRGELEQPIRVEMYARLKNRLQRIPTGAQRLGAN